MSTFRILLALAMFISNSFATEFCRIKNNPSSSGYGDSRIKTFIYNPDEVFTVVFSQGYYSYIEFAEGERIRNIAVGDASSWKISPYENKLLIMPFEASGRTNMIVSTTKKRNYIFDLVSKANFNKYTDIDAKKVSNNNSSSEEGDISYVVRFYYPQEGAGKFGIDDVEQLEFDQTQYDKNDLELLVQENDTKYNYTYVDRGTSTDIIPIEVFDDGYLTYFKFKDSNKIPFIFTEEDDVRLPCKRLLFDGYIIIKGVHKRLFMRYDNNEIEIINRSL